MELVMAGMMRTKERSLKSDDKVCRPLFVMVRGKVSGAQDQINDRNEIQRLHWMLEEEIRFAAAGFERNSMVVIHSECAAYAL